jgi:hypothetical protein
LILFRQQPIDTFLDIGIHFLQKFFIACPLKYFPHGQSKMRRFLGVAFIVHETIRGHFVNDSSVAICFFRNSFDES